jgi:hypothetical protein
MGARQMKRFILTGLVGMGCLLPLMGCVVPADPGPPVAYIPPPVVAPVVVGPGVYVGPRYHRRWGRPYYRRGPYRRWHR